MGMDSSCNLPGPLTMGLVHLQTVMQGGGYRRHYHVTHGTSSYYLSFVSHMSTRVLYRQTESKLPLSPSLTPSTLLKYRPGISDDAIKVILKHAASTLNHVTLCC